MSEIPDARLDGLCADCGVKPAVTRDKRFCKRCLRARINHDTYCAVRWRRGARGTIGVREWDMSPSDENAARVREDG